MRSGLEGLLERAERRKRAREAERLQALIDRYDSEEQEAQGDMAGARTHMAETSIEAVAPHRTVTHRARRGEAPRSHGRHEAGDPDDDESESERPQRRVTFHQPSLDVLESRVGQPRGPSPPGEGRLTREDIHHGQSRVGRRRRTPSPDGRMIEQHMPHRPGRSESRIGRHHRPAPTPDRTTSGRNHDSLGAGEPRIGSRVHRGPQVPPPSETLPQGAVAAYKSPPAPHGGHPTVDDGLLLNVPRTVGPPSSTGATCGNGSQASETGSSDRQQMLDRYRRGRDTQSQRAPQHHYGYERDSRQRNSPPPEAR